MAEKKKPFCEWRAARYAEDTGDGFQSWFRVVFGNVKADVF
jgi:hypothetical protein